MPTVKCYLRRLGRRLVADARLRKSGLVHGELNRVGLAPKVKNVNQMKNKEVSCFHQGSRPYSEQQQKERLRET
jgi:hypothetical protein